VLGGVEMVRTGEEGQQPLQVWRGPGPLDDLALANDHRPIGIADAAGSLTEDLQPMRWVGLGELRTHVERRQVGIDEVAVDRADVLHRYAVDRPDLGDHEVDQRQVLERDGQLVDDAATAGLEDLDAEHVAAHGSDATRHLTERPGRSGSQTRSTTVGTTATLPTAPVDSVAPA
jgi:hypothetical protein